MTPYFRKITLTFSGFVAVSLALNAVLGPHDTARARTSRPPKLPTAIQKFIIARRADYIAALEKSLAAAVKRGDSFGKYTAALAMTEVNPAHQLAAQHLKAAQEEIRLEALTKGRPLVKTDIDPYKGAPFSFVNNRVYLGRGRLRLGRSSYGMVVMGQARSSVGVQFAYGGGAFRFHWSCPESKGNPALRSGRWTEWGLAYFGREIAFMWVGKDFYGKPDGHRRGPSMWIGHGTAKDIELKNVIILD